MRLFIVFSTLCLTACAQPVLFPIFIHTYEPLTKDFNETPVGERRASSDLKQVRYGTYVDIRWDSNAIGELGRAAGLEEVYYADLETLNILGVWRQQRVLLYGK